jgi:hypothetical protein
LLSFGAESFVFQSATKTIRIKLYRNTMSPDVLYGCETWILTLREESRLRVLEDRVPRRGKRQMYTGFWCGNLGKETSWKAHA